MSTSIASAKERTSAQLYVDQMDPTFKADCVQIMLRNIPNKVDQAMLKRIVDESSWGKYDFMYLRIDFANDCKYVPPLIPSRFAKTNRKINTASDMRSSTS